MTPSLPPALTDFMHQYQYQPRPLKPSGDGFLRFPVANDSNGNTSGYVKLFPGGKSAIFGDFKSDRLISWHETDGDGLSPSARKTYQDELERARQKVEEERRRLQTTAARRAAEIYGGAKDARADHPYLVKKSINPCGGIRQSGSQLFVPVYVEDKLTSLQFIEEDGTKRFMSGGEIKGGYHVLGTPSHVLCIAEGYATGCSIHEATSHAVAVAFNAGNVMHVAHAMRRQYMDATLILCADDDRWTEGNPGLTKATEAATAVHGLLAVPDFSGCDMSSRPTDFNDLYVLAGKDAVKQAIPAATRTSGAHEPALGPPTPDSHPTGRIASIAPVQRIPQLPAAPACQSPRDTDMTDKATILMKDQLRAAIRADDEVVSPRAEYLAAGTGTSRVQLHELRAPLAPPQMPDIGYPPLIRDIKDVACRSSEAHPVAVSANALAYFSAMLGRGVYQRIGDAVIHCRPFLLIVGKSGKARKGTAEVTVTKIFARTQIILNQSSPGLNDCLKVYNGSLSTGEGIAMHIRDPRDADKKDNGSDPGVSDKRMLVTESEFENVFSHTRRDNNNLSATIRNVFDGRDLKTLTKTDPITATRPHICITGHITGHELRLKATENDVANGLLNRFLIAHVYRPKLVPLPEPTPDEKIEALAQQLADVIKAVTNGDLHGDNLHEVTFSDEARELWIEQYRVITRDREGKGGSLLARSEMYARMLAMIFAALDGRLVIEPKDLLAAFAWIEYWNASITYVFNCEDNEGDLDPFVAEVLEVVAKTPGISLSRLQATWLHKRTKQVKEALEVLLNLAPPLIEQRKEPTVGRPVHRYFTYGKK
jgi:phage/plasmid primase-like uncharacterized protein